MPLVPPVCVCVCHSSLVSTERHGVTKMKSGGLTGGEDLVDLTDMPETDPAFEASKRRKQCGIPDHDPDALPSSMVNKYLCLPCTNREGTCFSLGEFCLCCALPFP